MTSTTAAPRALARALTAAVAGLLALAAPAALATEPEAADFDARPDAAAAPGPPGAEAARDRLRERLGRFGTLTVDDRTGTLRASGSSTASSPARAAATAAAVALGYVRDNAARLRRRRRATSTACGSSRAASTGGIEHLAWEQRVPGSRSPTPSCRRR